MAANVTVLGAGVSGLTTAFLLSKDPKNKITIVAKHMPGDYDIEYASPWAGADLVPPYASMGGSSPDKEPFELATWPELANLAENVPEAGIHFQKAVYYRRSKDVGTAKGAWFEDLLREDNPFRKILPNYHIIPPSELPADMDAAVSFTTVCINTALYLPWLASQCLKAGAVIRRGVLSHISEAADLHHSGKPADIVVNCTGLSSLRLGGVEDLSLYPSRGQTVIVRNDPGIIVGSTGTDDGPDESMYIMNRAGGGGCVLGGCTIKGSWESQPDPNLAVRIMKRAIEARPELVAPGKGIEGLSVIRHAVGLRPMRVAGIRNEREDIKTSNGHAITVVHNYGHGGAGYQTSYGAARMAVGQVEEALRAKAKNEDGHFERTPPATILIKLSI